MSEQAPEQIGAPAVEALQRGTLTQSQPTIDWYPAEGEFKLTLMGVSVKKVEDPKRGCRFTLPMPVLYEVRVRKAGDEHWILGMILPFPGVEVTGVEPEAEYEIQTTILSRDKKPLGGPMVQQVTAAER